MKGWIITGGVFAVLAAAWFSWFGRYSTNTAAGRFYKNDRWTGETLVVEKDGCSHMLVKNYRPPATETKPKSRKSKADY